MKKNHTHFFQFLPRYVLLIFCLMTFFCTPLDHAIAEESCTELLKNRCESCHYLTRVCQKVEREMNKKRLFGGPEGTWKRTMSNMVKQGAKLNAKEEDILVTCLSEPSAEALDICKIKK